MNERIVANMPEDWLCFIAENAIYVDESGTIWVNGDYDYYPWSAMIKEKHFPVLRDGEEVIMDIHEKPEKFREMDILDTRSSRFRVNWVDGLVR